eukprot:scaffold10_cov257-Pinguiococcus_pyrenoidosus.AAC.33
MALQHQRQHYQGEADKLHGGVRDGRQADEEMPLHHLHLDVLVPQQRPRGLDHPDQEALHVNAHGRKADGHGDQEEAIAQDAPALWAVPARLAKQLSRGDEGDHRQHAREEQVGDHAQALQQRSSPTDVPEGTSEAHRGQDHGHGDEGAHKR